MALKLNKPSPAFKITGVALLLFLIFIQLAFSVHQESISWDEGDHLFSGYMSLKHADFGLNPEHPPLVKFVAALPLLPLKLVVPKLQNRSFKVEAFLDGKEFASSNIGQNILFRARMAASVFSLALALLIFFATREMFGTVAAFIALALLAFDPNILANGAFVTTDVGVSCCMLASIYAFYRYAKSPSAWRLVVVGVATGLALAAKHTGVLLLPMMFLLAIIEIWRRVPEGAKLPWQREALRWIGMLAGTTVIAFTILWGFYGFRYQARPAGLSLNPPMGQYLENLSKPSERYVLGTAARLHLLPESYLYGMADIQMVDDFYTSYFFGKVYPHGVWFYFPGVIAIKSTLPFLLLLALSIAAMATRRFRQWREILFLAVPSLFYLAIAMSSHMNIGARHILPMYVFLYVLLGGGASALISKNQRWAYVVLLLVFWQAVDAARIFPNYIAFANELWGGPANTHKYLSDANVDWAQQLIATRQYLDKRGIKDCWFLYFAGGVADINSYGIPCKLLPNVETLWWLDQQTNVPESIDGTVLISAGDLAGMEFGPAPLNPYEQFKNLHPTAVIQYGVFVYDGHFRIPLASALSHAQISQDLMKENETQQALTEAEQAVKLAPEAVVPNTQLGDVLTEMKRPAEARPYYEKALTLCKTVQPEFQQGYVADLEKKLAAK